jgi:hypothetical protein
MKLEKLKKGNKRHFYEITVKQSSMLMLHSPQNAKFNAIQIQALHLISK